MVVRYQIRAENVVAGLEDRLSMDKSRSFGASSIFISALTGVLLFGALGDKSRLLALAVGLISAAMVFITWRRLTRDSAKSSITALLSAWDDPIELGDREVTLTPKGVEEEFELGARKYKWATVKRARATASHVFLYMGPLTALTIPLNSLSEGVSPEELMQAISTYMGAEIERV